MLLNIARRMASASVLQRLQQRAKQAEDIITELKGQIESLRQTSAITASKPEEVRLRSENGGLRKEIEQLKVQLVLAEIQNGVKQVPLPKKQAITSSSATTVDAKPAEATNKAPVASKPEGDKGATKKEKTKDNVKKAAEKGEPKAKKAAPAAPAADAPMDVSRLDFRVGHIVSAKRHPDADSLYIEDVDLGEGRVRTVVSGLVKFIPLEEMQDRIAVFMCNLKPAKMRGVLSEAMIMCASTPEKVEILTVPDGAKVGDRVSAEGYEGEPDAMLNPKKKVWETLAPDLRTNASRVATWKGAPLMVAGKGQIIAPSLASVQIK